MPGEIGRPDLNIRLVTCGDGTMRPQIGQAAERLGTADGLTMPGNVDAARLALTSLDDLVPALVQEGTGEAMLDGRTGLLVHEVDAPGDDSGSVSGGRRSGLKWRY